MSSLKIKSALWSLHYLHFLERFIIGLYFLYFRMNFHFEFAISDLMNIAYFLLYQQNPVYKITVLHLHTIRTVDGSKEGGGGKCTYFH